MTRYMTVIVTAAVLCAMCAPSAMALDCTAPDPAFVRGNERDSVGLEESKARLAELEAAKSLAQKQTGGVTEAATSARNVSTAAAILKSALAN